MICEIMNYDGTMARVPDLVDYCRIHNLKMISVEQLIRYRLENDLPHDRDLIPAVSSTPVLYREIDQNKLASRSSDASHSIL